MNNKRNLIIAKTITDTILCGSAIWAISRTNQLRHPIALSSYVYLLGSGITEIISNICAPLENETDEADDRTRLLATIVPIAFLNMEMLLADSSCGRVMLYSHAYSTIIPTFLEASATDDYQYGILMARLGNTTTLSFLSYANGNVFGSLAAAVNLLQIFAHDYLSNESFYLRNSISTLFSSGFCILSVLATQLIKDNEV